jgi:hypothetical protein
MHESEHRDQGNRPTRPPEPAAPAKAEDQPSLQRRAGNTAVSRAVQDNHDSQDTTVPMVLRSTGRPLPGAVRADMESRLGADFAGVRLHTGPTAARSAAEIGARAYTSGEHVVLGEGGGDAHTLAHELTHVIQQREGAVSGADRGDGLRISNPQDSFERAAEANATRVMRAAAPTPASLTPAQASARPGNVQRMFSAEAGPSSTVPGRKILLVIDESGYGLGGVPVFNLELTRGLAPDNQVTLLTVNGSPQYENEKARKDHVASEQDLGNVKIVNIPPTAEQADGGIKGRKLLDELAAAGSRPAGLEDQYDIVMGHSRFSGPAAATIREMWFPSARLVHFLHTSPVRLDMVKEPEADPFLDAPFSAGPATESQRPTPPENWPDSLKKAWQKGNDKADIEKSVMAQADLVVGVGELLAREADRLAQRHLGRQALHALIPGTTVGEPRPPLTRGSGPIKLLLSGRAVDPIKGVEPILKVIRRIRSQWPLDYQGDETTDLSSAYPELRQFNVHLIVRGGPGRRTAEDQAIQDAGTGASEDVAEYDSDNDSAPGTPGWWPPLPAEVTEEAEKTALRRRWDNIVQIYGSALELRHFTSNPADLERDRQDADAIIMPSLHEGFGLVATEGAGVGIPVVVNSESGAADFLRALGYRDSVVPIANTAPPPFTTEDQEDLEEFREELIEPVDDWETAIRTLAQDLAARETEAREIRGNLQGYSWKHAAQALVKAAMQAPLLADRMRDDVGRVTFQDVEGGLKDLTDEWRSEELNPAWSGLLPYWPKPGP